MAEMRCKLKTGDLILCDDLEYKSWGLLSWVIKFATKSDFSHVGMIVVDPEFTDVSLKGTYVWTSGISDVPDPEDNTKKFGVQFVPYDHFITTYGGKIYVRRIEFESIEEYNKIFNFEKLKFPYFTLKLKLFSKFPLISIYIIIIHLYLLISSLF
jgi:hypothetical protein